MKHLRLVIRDGVLFGVIGGVFGIVVIVVAVYVAREFPLSNFSSLTGTVVSFLLFGAAGRKVALATKSATAAWQLGAIAGGVSELIRTVAIGVVLSLSPTAQAAYNRLTPGASGAATQIANLAVYLAAAIIFGGLAAWLGAWSLLRFGPPSAPKT